MKRIFILTIICIFSIIACTNNNKEGRGRMGSHENAVNAKTTKEETESASASDNGKTNDASNTNGDFSNTLIPILVSLVLSLFICSLIAYVYVKYMLRDKIVEEAIGSKRFKQFIENNTHQKKFQITDVELNLITNKVIERVKLEQGNNTDLIIDGVLKCLKLSNPLLFKEEILTQTQQIVEVNSFAATTNTIQTRFSVEPRNSNYFDNDGLSEQFKPTESVYKFELTKDNTAKFWVIKDFDTMSRAINYKKELLDTACESFSSSVDAKSIVTTDPGIAQKEDNKWIIKQKAKIKFI